ncbi:Cytochrome c family protein [Dissulfuribacter thermophilus]|uniref:Cytochrome c family protein n=1 Tax=Dissulfuribacter thermophilus TaxID=1156395 RepID=A0A1B9F4J0_9BACT|nr:hypothetical protein [Dissulfuribacter thermophilus]OCC14842.1 Cytochrome c family protein [Dissulfuribacter thermophilus]
MKRSFLMAFLGLIWLGSYVHASICEYEYPAFEPETKVVDIPCIDFMSQCYHVVISIDDKNRLILEEVEDVGASVPTSALEASVVPFVDFDAMVLHIPELRVQQNNGDPSVSAFSVDLNILPAKEETFLEIGKVTPVAASNVCGGTEGNDTNSQNSSNSSVHLSPTTEDYIVVAYNDLGMHCMNQDHSILSLLPPYNTLVAQVIKRGEDPEIISNGVTLEYRLLENTTCQGSNFWDYVFDLFGKDIPFCTGLTGNSLQGQMELRGDRFFAEGIPVTPFNDDGSFNPYPLAEVVAKDAATGQVLASTQTVIPISYEMNCQKCHGGTGGSDTMTTILKLHDQKEGTSLATNTPVLCQDCHADPALNAKGVSGIPNLSLATHGKHAGVSPQPTCYDCHPGPQTQCLRTDIEGMQTCENCHGTLEQMAQGLRNGRTPWLEEPKCSQCHQGSEIDTGNELYRNAKGHHGVYCETCHYEPHAWWPSKLDRDNQQAITLQGGTGPLGSVSCLACHTSVPDGDEGPHGLGANGSKTSESDHGEKKAKIGDDDD